MQLFKFLDEKLSSDEEFGNPVKDFLPNININASSECVSKNNININVEFGRTGILDFLDDFRFFMNVINLKIQNMNKMVEGVNSCNLQGDIDKAFNNKLDEGELNYNVSEKIAKFFITYSNRLKNEIDSYKLYWKRIEYNVNDFYNSESIKGYSDINNYKNLLNNYDNCLKQIKEILKYYNLKINEINSKVIEYSKLRSSLKKAGQELKDIFNEYFKFNSDIIKYIENEEEMYKDKLIEIELE